MTPRYYIQVGDKREGPFTWGELLGAHYDGEIEETTPVWDADANEWYPFSKLKMLYQAMLMTSGGG